MKIRWHDCGRTATLTRGLFTTQAAEVVWSGLRGLWVYTLTDNPVSSWIGWRLERSRQELLRVREWVVVPPTTKFRPPGHGR